MLSYCKTEKEDRVYIFLRQNKGTKQYRLSIKCIPLIHKAYLERNLEW
jgi:hypothetical protein